MAPARINIEIIEDLSRQGERCVSKGRVGAAIEVYTEVIALCPHVPLYLTKRASCYLEQGYWRKVEGDCRKALLLDGNSVMAHYLLGKVLKYREEYSEAVVELKKAFELEKIANPWSPFKEEIRCELNQAKYQEWEEESSLRKWRHLKLKDACEKALIEKFQQSNLQGDDYEESLHTHTKRLEHLEEVFGKVIEFDTPTEIPDYLCCKISLDIFRDPVITPSGITYEKEAIENHLEQVGKFDPITRVSLCSYELRPNHAMKQAVQAFLDKHGWAYMQS